MIQVVYETIRDRKEGKMGKRSGKSGQLTHMTYKLVLHDLKLSFVDEPEKLVMNVYDRNDALGCLLYTSPSPRDRQKSRMPSSA